MGKIEEIAKELETAGFALNAAHKLFNQLNAENKECLSDSDRRAWNAAVRAFDELSNAREWMESHDRII